MVRSVSTERQLRKKVLYFAYGSNMHQPRLEARVGKVKCLGVYTLTDYKLTFDTGSIDCSYANVEQVEGESCEGVVYEMLYGQLKMLDYYEGLYDRIQEEYKGRKLHVYISEQFRNKRREPELTIEYHSILVLGCKAHNLQKSLAIVNSIQPRPNLILWSRLGYFD